jgi:hypothetical protein
MDSVDNGSVETILSVVSYKLKHTLLEYFINSKK